MLNVSFHRHRRKDEIRSQHKIGKSQLNFAMVCNGQNLLVLISKEIMAAQKNARMRGFQNMVLLIVLLLLLLLLLVLLALRVLIRGTSIFERRWVIAALGNRGHVSVASCPRPSVGRRRPFATYSDACMSNQAVAYYRAFTVEISKDVA